MLRNLALRFDPVEDRLLLRLEVAQAGEAAAVHWLHLTRRVCEAWRRDLQAMVELSAEVPARLDAPAKAAVSSAHHQAMAKEANVRTEPAARAPEPSGQPLLVTRIVCGHRQTGGGTRWLIRFDCRDHPPLNLLLSGRTLHGLVDALSRRVKSAGWALPPLPVESQPPGTVTPSAQMH